MRNDTGRIGSSVSAVVELLHTSQLDIWKPLSFDSASIPCATRCSFPGFQGRVANRIFVPAWHCCHTARSRINFYVHRLINISHHVHVTAVSIVLSYVVDVHQSINNRSMQSYKSSLMSENSRLAYVQKRNSHHAMRKQSKHSATIQP